MTKLRQTVRQAKDAYRDQSYDGDLGNLVSEQASEARQFPGGRRWWRVAAAASVALIIAVAVAVSVRHPLNVASTAKVDEQVPVREAHSPSTSVLPLVNTIDSDPNSKRETGVRLSKRSGSRRLALVPERRGDKFQLVPNKTQPPPRIRQPESAGREAESRGFHIPSFSLSGNAADTYVVPTSTAYEFRRTPSLRRTIRTLLEVSIPSLLERRRYDHES